MLDGVPAATRLQFATLLLAPATLRNELFGVLVAGEAPRSESGRAAMALLADLSPGLRLPLCGLLQAHDTVRTRLAGMLQESLFASPSSVPVPAPASTPVPALVPASASAVDAAPALGPRPVRPRGQVTASALADALQQARGMLVHATSTARQVYMRFIVHGAMVGDGGGDGTTDAENAEFVTPALRVMIPRLKLYLEAQWHTKYPGTSFSVMSFSGTANPANSHELLLHMVSRVDADASVDLARAALEFSGHLLAQLHGNAGCIDTTEINGRAVMLIAAADPASVRVAAMGTMSPETTS